MKKVYIMKEEVPSMDLAAAHYGFKKLGYQVIFYEDIEEVPKGALAVVGYIDDLQSYFVRSGLPKQVGINIPPELAKREYLLRHIWYGSMREFRETAQVPIFIKPARYPKEFMAGVITKESSKDFLSDVADDTPVLTSSVIDILSEYRCYVLNGRLLGIKNYSGDIRIFPDIYVIDRMIAEYKSAPRGYSIDVGITSKGETVLIEVQDGWALGNYGLEPMEYASLLLARWTQLLQHENKNI